VLRGNNLGPRDAFHVANLFRGGIGTIATMDGDFDALPGFTVLKIA
jgi:predicted nucleic acid-binding protein